MGDLDGTALYSHFILHNMSPPEGALHLLPLLLRLFDLRCDMGQELFKVGQEVRLIFPESSPQVANLTRAEMKRKLLVIVAI